MALKIKPEVKPEPLSIKKSSDRDKPFSSLNFWLMGGCLILILLGYLFMSGGGSDTPEGFNPEIFSTRRIVVGPLLSFLGFLFMAFAIICPPVSPRQVKEWSRRLVFGRKDKTENS